MEGRGEEREKLPETLGLGLCEAQMLQHRELTQISRYITHTWDILKYFDVPQVPTESTF